MSLFERLTKKAQLHPQRLVLPESKEPRTLQAAERILADKIAEIIFLGKKEEILAEAEKLGLKHIAEARFHNPDDTSFTEKYAGILRIEKEEGRHSRRRTLHREESPLSRMPPNQGW